MSVDASLAIETYCYLTTTGRVTGNPHTVEIWFALRGSRLYMLAGDRERSDWVRNLRKEASVTVRIRDTSFAGTAVIVTDLLEDALVRDLLLAKYKDTYRGSLVRWSREALPVAIDLGE
jgi:deazaflavin-dependent oxidoreductase (nitroreductase family)